MTVATEKDGGAAAAPDLSGVSVDALLSELGRRGCGVELDGAVGALHDHLDRTGALDSHHTAYLAYRLRREAYRMAFGLPAHERERMAAVWEQEIGRLEEKQSA